MVSSETPPRAGRREWIGLAVLWLPCMLYSMDLTVLHLAVPAVTADLQPSSAELLWIIDIYGFFVAGSLITMGTLGDRIGRRKLLLIGAAFFGVASVFAAFSRTAETLILTRALLGLAGATVAPSTLSLIRNMFLDARERTVAISVWITAYSVGAAIGPFIGGLLLEFFWWGSVFLIAVPVMVLLLIVGPMLLPEYKDPNAGRIDLPSAGLSVAAVLAVIFGLKEMAQDGASALAVGVIVAGLALGWTFVRRQRRLADPLIDLALFAKPAFSASVATYGLAVFVVFGAFLFLPQYLQLVRGLTPLEAGLWGIPAQFGFIGGSVAVPALGRRMKPAAVMAIGLVCAAGGFAFLTQIDEGTSLLAYVIATIVFSLGTAPVFTMTNDLIIGSAPPERAGAAAGISETSAEFSGALGIAVYGSIGVAIYRTMLSDASVPGVPREALDAAMDTLGAALLVAADLPAAVGAELVSAARAAFMVGVWLCAGISTAATFALALFVWRRLRHVAPAPPGA
jgi:DHA2 family multidrug resistance protein-like MFS transporter